MDLNVLFAAQVKQLEQCYVNLGHAPQRLQQALQSAVEQELAKTLSEVNEAKRQIESLTRRCEAYRDVLSADGAQVVSTLLSSSSSSSSREGHRVSETLMTQIDSWQAELVRMERQYAARRSHVDKLIASLDVYRPILADFVPEIEGSSSAGRTHEAEESLQALPIPSLRHVESTLARCKEELQSRTDTLQADVNEVLQLWAEMALLPSSEDELDARIMRHLGVVPRLVDVGEGCMDFCGDFDEVQSIGAAADEDVGSSTSDFSRPGAMLPTLDNMGQVRERRTELEEERTRRTERMQALYDELIPLWQRFDVAEEDVDAFVQANCGCSLTVMEAYESELRQMRELKSQHMALFIVKVREDIDQLWDQLMMTSDERRDSFAPFFYDLSEGTSEETAESGIDPSDELLALHEEKVKALQDELATRARPLELVRQYMRLLDEAKALEESAKDTSRLTGRGAPGQRRDPGRLLREEKMRKRIKILKPKVEEDLLRTIPAWEEESGRPFIIHGARFLDSVDLQSQQQKKRPRTISNTQASTTSAGTATPQMPATKRNHMDGSAARSVSASAAGSSALRKGAQHLQHPQSTPTAASMSNGGRPRHVTGPMSANGGLPTPASASAQSRTFAKKASATTITQPSTSSMSLASQATDVSSVTTVVLKPGPKANGTSSMQPPALPIGRTPAKGTLTSRPSMLLEASLRKAPRPSSDYAKPTSTGAGATLRAYTNASRNDSLGPNWAMLAEDEDEENLLMM